MGNIYLYNATAKTTGHKHEKPNYNMQIVFHIKEEENADRNDLINLEVFKPISKNVMKQLRIQPETHRTTRTIIRAGKSAEAFIKQFAN